MKYFSKKIRMYGQTFDSRTEAKRYALLDLQQSQGIIRDLELQKEFELLPKQMRKEVKHLKTKDKIVERVDEQAVHYHADFFYFDTITQRYIIEEVKSAMTAKIRDYPLRRKLVKLMIKRMNEEAGSELYAFREIIA